MGESLESSFGRGEPFSVGVEEELFLVDPLSGEQINASAAVRDRVGEIDGRIERELHASQIELITNVCTRVSETSRALSAMRQAVIETGAGLLGSGTHPTAVEGEAHITDKERYEHIHDLLGDAVATPVGGMHIHIGMPDGDTAIRVFNGLRRHLPLLQALAANSPFRHGRDTGLASAREVTIRGWPRSGVPRAMRDLDDFEEMAQLLVRAAEVPDYTWFWWKVRPHPRLGTVEIRAVDAQTSLEDAAGLTALIHCLARHAAEADPRRDPPGEVLEEASFRAARFGVEARLPDVDGALVPVSQLVDEALEIAGGYAGELGCVEELGKVREIVERGGGAARQRGIHAISGMSGLLRQLTGMTREA